MVSDSGSITFDAKHRLAAFTILSLVVFSCYAALDFTSAQRWTFGARDIVTGYFDWLMVLVVGGVLVIAVLLALHPGAKGRIGLATDRPEFSRWSWFAMLFSAGLASGLIYWGAAEPITHLAGSPFAELGASPAEDSTRAIALTIFHWGLHGWGLYAIGGLAIGLAAYRRGRPLTFSAALAPILGERHAAGWAGKIADLIALYGTVFGVATSIGIAVGSMNAAIEPLIGLPFTLYTQLGMVLVASALGVLSVLSGVAKGVRRLSEVNVWLSLGLLLLVLFAGPTASLFAAFPATLADYAVNVLPMGFWIADDAAGQSWQSGWTVFYWGWWLAWTPFVAMFIARISKGRTIREFILGVLIVPALVVVLWMTVLGGTAIHQELNTPGAVSVAVAQDYSLGLVATIQNLEVAVFQETLRIALLALVAILLFTWLITSLDSATLVICHILHVDHLGSMKILWGFLLAAVTCTLMLIGGIEALQAASIIIGLPMALLMIVLTGAAIKLVVAPLETQSHPEGKAHPNPGTR